MLQALSRLGILPYVDYLSTVSGGGYIGSCLTSLLSHPSSAKLKPDSRIFKGGEAPYFTTHKATFPFNANAAEQPALSGFDGRDATPAASSWRPTACSQRECRRLP